MEDRPSTSHGDQVLALGERTGERRGESEPECSTAALVGEEGVCGLGRQRTQPPHVHVLLTAADKGIGRRARRRFVSRRPRPQNREGRPVCGESDIPARPGVRDPSRQVATRLGLCSERQVRRPAGGRGSTDAELSPCQNKATLWAYPAPRTALRAWQRSRSRCVAALSRRFLQAPARAPNRRRGRDPVGAQWMRICCRGASWGRAVRARGCRERGFPGGGILCAREARAMGGPRSPLCD